MLFQVEKFFARKYSQISEKMSKTVFARVRENKKKTPDVQHKAKLDYMEIILPRQKISRVSFSFFGQAIHGIIK